MELEGKVCLVTGGSSGIGKATCELLTSLKAKVSICDLDSVKGEALAKELNGKYGSEVAIFNRCDVTDINTIRECFKATVSKLGQVDVLFNNAGVWDDSPTGWSKQVDINLKGPINGCIVAMEFMGAQNGGKGGTVVSTSSYLAVSTFPVMPIYSATKAGVLAFTRAFGTPFHYELNKIRYMCLCPHGTGTNLFNDMEKHFLVGGETLTKVMKQLTDTGRLQGPENVAKAFVHALKNGENGSAWYIEMDKPPQEVKITDMSSKPNAEPEVVVSV